MNHKGDYLKALFFTLATVIPPACGGGGSGTSPDTQNPDPPVLTPDSGITPNATVSGTVVLKATASDDSDIVARVEFYVASEPTLACADNTAKESGSVFSCSWNSRSVPDGDHTLTVRAYDQANHFSETSPIPFKTSNPNNAPQITSGPAATPTTINEGAATNLSVTASDPDGDTLSYSWSQTSPASPTGTFSNPNAQNPTWTAPQVSANTTFTLRVTVSDGKGGTTQGNVNVTVNDIPPVTLTIQKNGSGIVTSNPSGINCGRNCQMSVNAGTQVTLTAQAGPGQSFTGWSGGGCTGTTSNCVLTVSANTTVQANFTQPSYANDIQPIWTANCAKSGCHTGASPAGNLNLSSGVSHGQLVNVQAQSSCTTMKRVLPDDPDNSVLWRKITGATCGARMPLDNPSFFDTNTNLRDKIRSWIMAGAPNN